MDYTIVSGNRPSAVPLHQNPAIVFNEMIKNCQIFVLNLNMPYTKWDGSEEPAINNFFKIDSLKFRICSLMGRSTEANHSFSYQPN